MGRPNKGTGTSGVKKHNATNNNTSNKEKKNNPK